MEMPCDIGIDMITKAFHAEVEDFVKARWVAGFQTIPFTEFKEKIGFTPPTARGRFLSKEDILADVRLILSAKAGEKQ